MCKIGMISQERLKVEVKLLLSANMKSCMLRQLAQQRMTLTDLQWPHRALSLSMLLLTADDLQCSSDAVPRPLS